MIRDGAPLDTELPQCRAFGCNARDLSITNRLAVAERQPLQIPAIACKKPYTMRSRIHTDQNQLLEIGAASRNRSESFVSYPIRLPSIDVEFPKELATLRNRREPGVRALRRLHQVKDLQIQAIGDGGKAAVADLEPLKMDLPQSGDPIDRDRFQNPVPVARAAEELQGLETLGAEYQRLEALAVVELFQADGFESGGRGAGADRLHVSAVGETTEPLD